MRTFDFRGAQIPMNIKVTKNIGNAMQKFHCCSMSVGTRKENFRKADSQQRDGSQNVVKGTLI